ncbi:MAG: FecR family protein [Cyclobacteriaceae bacterium]|nr:FecR family protein [Cyclobacteriaceae bacterium]
MNTIKILFILVSSIMLTSCGDVTVSTSDNYEQIELPDHSLVFLNQNSTLSYESAFNPRHITLTGEAFFSVKKTDNPFVIFTDLGDITVLGTEFNVNTSEEAIEIEVEEGNVELKSLGHSLKKEIKKGEKAILKSSKKIIEKGKAEYKHNAWINNLKAEFKKLGKELKSSGKKIGKEVKKGGKEVGKESKKLKKELLKKLNE